jgi:branched-chain amino acid transport system permease protein
VRNLLTPRNAINATFWPGALAVSAILFFVVYNNNNFAGQWVLFSLYLAINLMWMLVIGTAGIYSFATIAIVGVSAYLVTYLAGGSTAGLDFASAKSMNVGLMLVIAAAAGAVVGALVAAPAIRLRGVYFALFTIGLVEVGRAIAVQQEVLGQNQGLYGATTFKKTTEIGTATGRNIDYLVGLALIVFCLLVYRLVDGGRLGLLLRTARESEPFARELGVGVVWARFAVFIISSAVLGLVGGFYAASYGGVSPAIFSFDTLLLLLAMIVVGGLGSAKGALLGTALLLFIDFKYSESGAPRLIAIGIIMLAITLGTTRGIVGLPAQLRGYWERYRGRRGPPGEEPTPTEAELEVPGL